MTLKTDYAVEETIPAVENLIKNRDWRDDAIHASLATEAEDGDSIDTLLRETRRAQRGCATLMLWLDRPRLREFLQTQATGFRSLLPGTDGYRGYETAEDVRPYVAWYAAEWEGRTIEVALAPTTAYTGYVLCIADEETYLHRFAEAAVSFVNRPVGRSLRYAQGWESAEDIDAQIPLVTWDEIVLPPAQTAQIREAVEGFVQSRETYARFGFSWRRGILLIGPPGTGKTMICKAVASSLPSLPFLYVRDLSERAKRDAIQAIFERARQLAPCILVFEDMDGFITKENRTLFLNEMDGFKNNDGLLVIASSNHPDKIDEALIKRPSRFDRVFHIGLPGLEERREYCRQVLTRSAMSKQIAPSLDIEELAEHVAARTEKFTPAYLKEALLSAALLRAQAGAEELDSTYAKAVLDQIEEMRASFKRLKNLAALGEISTGMDMMGLRR